MVSRAAAVWAVGWLLGDVSELDKLLYVPLEGAARHAGSCSELHCPDAAAAIRVRIEREDRQRMVGGVPHPTIIDDFNRHPCESVSHVSPPSSGTKIDHSLVRRLRSSNLTF